MPELDSEPAPTTTVSPSRAKPSLKRAPPLALLALRDAA
jgi:hypothetical protein